MNPPSQPYRLTIAEASRLMREKALSPVELIDSVLRRIEETEGRVHAYAFVATDTARSAAAAAEREIAHGDWKGPLHGIPVNIKDVFYTKGVPTEAGSRVLQGFVPNHDSGVAERLSVAGAILIGKSITHEFAYGQNVVPTRNPWNLNCYPGGSSAGAGVSVAIDSTLGAVGGDGGGSIRGPGAVNGIAALKPTFGRVSKRGMIPNSFTLDAAGPLTKTVLDSALMLNALSGYDPLDPTSVNVRVPDFTAGLDRDIKGVRLGLDPDHFLPQSVAPAVRAAFEAALRVFEELGATIVRVKVPYIEYAATAGWTIIMVDGSVYHRRWLREKADLYEPGTRLMIEAGELLPATDYLLSLKVRHLLKAAMRDAFRTNRLDALVSPTSATTTQPLDHPWGVWKADGPADSGLERVRQAIPFNLTGQPALNVPCGFSEERLTIGLQVAGRPFDEAMVFRIARAYEAATSWHLESPPL